MQARLEYMIASGYPVPVIGLPVLAMTCSSYMISTSSTSKMSLDCGGILCHSALRKATNKLIASWVPLFTRYCSKMQMSRHPR